MTQSFSGLGQDGYMRIQKEVNYGTKLTAAMKDLPVDTGSLFKTLVTPIENMNLISSRIKQAPDQGRIVRTGTINMDLDPTLTGYLMNLFLGASTDSTEETGVYKHVWLAPITGESIGKSFTGQQAIGADLADTYDGGVITDISITGDSTGNIKMTANCVFQGLTAGEARVTTFTYPSVVPYKFCHVVFTLNNGGAVTIMPNSFTLNIDLGYDKERFKLGSCEIQQPVFNTIPSGTLAINCDADRLFLTDARAYTNYAITLTITHTVLAGSTKPYVVKFEIPVAKLDPATEIPGDNDRLTMDLNFNLEGGVTTGSGTSLVMFEANVTDTTAAYA